MTIYATDYYATTQAVADAIDRSASHTEIVRIVAGASYDAITAELEREAELANDTDDGWDFCGRNLDGCDWRIEVIQ